MRFVGYGAVLALITAKAVEARDALQLGNYFQISKLEHLQAALWLLMCAYAAVVLYATSRHVPLKPRALTLAVVAGVVAGSAHFLRYGLHLWAWHVGWPCLCFVAAPALIGFTGTCLAVNAWVPRGHGTPAAVITGLTAAPVLAVLAACAVAISPGSAPLHSLPCARSLTRSLSAPSPWAINAPVNG